MSGIRRRLVVGLAFVVAGALTRIGIFPAEPAEASPRKGTRSGNATRALIQPTSGLQNVLTWNMCGGVDPCSENMVAPWQTAYAYIYFSSARPRAVMLQEVCQPQMAELNQVLPQIGYTGAKYWSNENINSACINHGNAVFWQGGNANSAPTFAYSTQGGEDDVRGYVCGQAASPLFLACSTHHAALDRNSGVRAQQRTEFRTKLDWKNANSGPTIAGGDFNAVPQDMNLFFEPNVPSYREGGYSGNTYNADILPDLDDRNSKLDYILLPYFQFFPPYPQFWCLLQEEGTTQDVSPNPLAGFAGDGTSDHLMYWSYASLCDPIIT